MTTKRITRSATGNLVKIAQPGFLSLVGKPANQRPFPIIRSEAAGAKPGRVARTKRGDNAVLMLTFPEGYTEDDATRSLAEFNMTGYSITTDGTSVYAHRSDLQSVAKVAEMKPNQIRLTSDGVMASIDPAQYQPKTAQSVSGVAVAAYEFDAKTFDAEKIISWGEQNNVDIQNDAIENSSGDVISVARGEVSEETEVKRVQIEDGVVAVIYQTEAKTMDSSPDMYSAAINEAAYGNWGWGQLDFAASMADRDFCNLLDCAASRVDSVIRQILFYSELPLESRKQLVTRCLQQYGQFVNDAIDGLPRQVLLLASRADVSKNQSLTSEDDTMKIAEAAAIAEKELAAIEAKRADEAKVAADKLAADEAAAAEVKRSADEAAAALAAAAAPAAVAAVVAPTADAPITRAELPALIAAAVAAAMAPAAAVVAAPAAVAAPAVRSDADLATAIAAAVTAANAPLLEKIERMEGATVLRSDGTDATKTVKTEEKQVFRGVFGDLGGAAKE